MVYWGISGTRACTERGSVLSVLLEVVAGWVGNVCMSVCFSVCLVFNLNLRVFGGFECAGKPLSQSGLSVQLLCEKTEVLKHLTS